MKDNLTDRQPVYRQPFRAEVEDITALVQSLKPIDELLAIKEELETGECMHYGPAEIRQLKIDVDKAYNSMPVRARPYIMNEMLSLWVQLSYL